MPTSDKTENAGANFVATVSFKPSAACPTVLYCVASLFSSVPEPPALIIAAKKSSVATVPAWTFCTNSDVVIPIAFATADKPAGVCSSINLKSAQATFGFAAICVACWDSVFIACCGFSAAAARPPKPFTSSVVFDTPTAANCE